MKCAEVQAAIPAYVGDPGSSLDVRRHLSRCPECRAELEIYEAMRAGLAQLRAVPADVPAGLVASLRAIPQSASPRELALTHLQRNRAAYAGGLAIAVAGGTAALLWRRRRLVPA
ncbi:MAG TPA: hypothetical protein VHJ82_10390 [Actinomycetota bacterium]|nr:hypothetical protein [Actinomycetota bacterium]